MRNYRLALPVLLFLGFAILAGGRAEAGSFQIAPTLGDVPPGKSTATFRIVNPGDDVLTVQVTAKRWTQQGNDDLLDDTEELLVVPPLVNIPAGQSQIIRVARRTTDTGKEASYRLFFHEVPAAPPAGFVGVQTSLRLSVPLFFAPEDGRGELAWNARKSASGNLQLHVTNRGSRFARITRIQLRDEKGREVAQINGPQYALTGAERYWELPGTANLPRDMKLTATVEMGSARQEFSLKIE